MTSIDGRVKYVIIFEVVNVYPAHMQLEVRDFLDENFDSIVDGILNHNDIWQYGFISLKIADHLELHNLYVVPALSEEEEGAEVL